MIHYRTGDASRPGFAHPCIAHVVNDVGRWGRGFTASLDAVSYVPRLVYRAWATQGRDQPPFALGQNRVAWPERTWCVVHMLAQHGVGRGVVRLDYTALDSCLAQLAHAPPAWTVVMPKIGSGLAGGDWARIEAAILRAFPTRDVYVYTLEGA